MLHPIKNWGYDAGQGEHNTLSTLAHTRMLNALSCGLKSINSAVFAHVGSRGQKAVDALEPIGVAPCLQIRLAQFDSGSRLQIKAVTIHSVTAFFRPFVFDLYVSRCTN